MLFGWAFFVFFCVGSICGMGYHDEFPPGRYENYPSPGYVMIVDYTGHSYFEKMSNPELDPVDEEQQPVPAASPVFFIPRIARSVSAPPELDLNTPRLAKKNDIPLNQPQPVRLSPPPLFVVKDFSEEPKELITKHKKTPKKKTKRSSIAKPQQYRVAPKKCAQPMIVLASAEKQERELISCVDFKPAAACAHDVSMKEDRGIIAKKFKKAQLLINGSAQEQKMAMVLIQSLADSNIAPYPEDKDAVALSALTLAKAYEAGDSITDKKKKLIFSIEKDHQKARYYFDRAIAYGSQKAAIDIMKFLYARQEYDQLEHSIETVIKNDRYDAGHKAVAYFYHALQFFRQHDMGTALNALSLAHASLPFNTSIIAHTDDTVLELFEDHLSSCYETALHERDQAGQRSCAGERVGGPVGDYRHWLYFVGRMYLDSQSAYAQKNKQKALGWMRAAADCGQVYAQLYLGAQHNLPLLPQEQIGYLRAVSGRFEDGSPESQLETDAIISLADAGYFSAIHSIFYTIGKSNLDQWCAMIEKNFPQSFTVGSHDGQLYHQMKEDGSYELLQNKNRWSAQAIRLCADIAYAVDSKNGPADLQGRLKIVDEAIAELNTMRKKHPKVKPLFSMAYAMKGYVYGAQASHDATIKPVDIVKLKKYVDQAVESYEKAFSLDGHNSYAKFEYARLHVVCDSVVGKNRKQKSIRLLQDVIKDEKSAYCIEAILLLARMYASENNFDESEHMLAQAERMISERQTIIYNGNLAFARAELVRAKKRKTEKVTEKTASQSDDSFAQKTLLDGALSKEKIALLGQQVGEAIKCLQEADNNAMPEPLKAILWLGIAQEKRLFELFESNRFLIDVYENILENVQRSAKKKNYSFKEAERMAMGIAQHAGFLAQVKQQFPERNDKDNRIIAEFKKAQQEEKEFGITFGLFNRAQELPEGPQKDKLLAVVKSKIDPDNRIGKDDLGDFAMQCFFKGCTAYANVWLNAKKEIAILVDNADIQM